MGGTLHSCWGRGWGAAVQPRLRSCRCGCKREGEGEKERGGKGEGTEGEGVGGEIVSAQVGTVAAAQP
ncbi:hypothetical protein TIFTF001_025175 [Ficus carica]|uniref:Uncharacterized protein n=1 Tax=Ficus carica TaxID=3494 RepID=A0AA88AWH5_FICCA|nr:hypothetical protein TIFTF001_025175 [Ficus carica]